MPRSTSPAPSLRLVGLRHSYRPCRSRASTVRLYSTGRRAAATGESCGRLIPCHAVADAGFGEDEGGVGRVVAELAAEVLDGGADRPHVAGVAPPPDAVEEMPVGQHAAGECDAALRIVDGEVAVRVGLGGIGELGGRVFAEGGLILAASSVGGRA